jgi:hypothetical protein
MSYLLEALRSWPVCPEVLDQLKAMPEWDQALEWGWARYRFPSCWRGVLTWDHPIGRRLAQSKGTRPSSDCGPLSSVQSR